MTFNKWADIVKCYGLTQNISNENYMLVMYKMDIDLRKYLQQNHNQLTMEFLYIFFYKLNQKSIFLFNK
jgi:hypothetical protein